MPSRQTKIQRSTHRREVALSVRRNSQRQMKENDQVWITVSPPCAMITPTLRPASGSVSPSPSGIPCAANAALNRLQLAADCPEMIIYRVGTVAITGVNDSLCCLRVDGLTLHTQMLSQTRVRNSQPPPLSARQHMLNPQCVIGPASSTRIEGWCYVPVQQPERTTTCSSPYSTR